MSDLNLEILAYEQTPLGLLFLRRRELLSRPGTFVTEVTLNHEFLMSSLYTDSERILAERALEMHGGDRLKVMVGGLGLGYTAQAALKSARVAHLEVVELLPQVIDWMRDGLVPLSAELNNEARLEISQGDVYQRLQDPPGDLFDLILIDVDHSPDERLAEENLSFYSVAGLEAARQHLLPGGVLAVWSYAESSPFADAMKKMLVDVTVVPVSYQNELIDEKRTDWLFFGRRPV
ncbi:MAG: spermidine synthase [Planctomycetota bacterium]|nr:spermidine synthase [Planctomycetota bacterium]